jgi:hypothetical protein
MKKRNAVQTERLQLSLDPQTFKILGEMAAIGLYGKNEAEVASFLLRTWLLANRTELGSLGIKLVRSPRP